MRKVVVTGANGFIGKNLIAHLKERKEIEIVSVTRNDDKEAIINKIKGAEIIYHLAGVNRPVNEEQFEEDNTLLSEIIFTARNSESKPFIFVYASSTQADQPNPYGQSKLQAEEIVKQKNKNAAVYIYRLPGVFGKWCKPNYNSVVATFCYNVANEIQLEVRDPSYALKLVYIDDVIDEFLKYLSLQPVDKGVTYASVSTTFTISLGELATIISSFPDTRKSLMAPVTGSTLRKYLYSTYLTYLPEKDFSYLLQPKSDNRGNLFELIKSETFGQIFISSTHSGITRGNHYHHTKTEKFVVIKGKAIIRLRNVLDDKVLEFPVSGESPAVVDIPPGYTHNITNVGDEEMITLFWANEIFDPQNTDTYFVPV